ncbi:MBOAT, membrane-bound O-acyltransferase family-domain-containing protein [Choanephora cucurbitarum]|nr:MBOAT, membrane-bound O-acyltransferase family-domain-containing protein [Choanephora cucurbitarum]
MNFITSLLSKVLGLPEPTLRLLLTLVLAYPVARLYQERFSGQDASTPQERTQFILLTGFALNFFFNGFSIIHTLITVAVSYGICVIVGEQMGDRKLAAAGVWIFNALYLLFGYYFMQTDDYDITWTMTQCILCLRLMGFGFDYYDGRKQTKTAGPPSEAEIKTVPEKELNKTAIRETADKKPPAALPLSFLADTPLNKLPTFVEVLAYTMFPSAFLVGPQFSYSLFKKWINNNPSELTIEQLEERERAQKAYVMRCVGLAVVYLSLQQTIGTTYSTSYLLTEEYQSFGFLKRALILIIAGKFAYNKYIGIWLLTEGATAYFGISYEGDDEEGRAMFGGLANTLPATFETASSIDHIISAFNINTNLWSKYYVFKRLKFLGNKQASQVGTLFFLAIWHGFHIMYFITFALEFLYVLCEQVLRKRLSPLVQPYIKKNSVYGHLWTAASWVACQLTVTYAIVGFELLKVGKSFTAYKSVWFIGHIAIAVILGANYILPKPRTVNKKSQ